MHLPSRSFLSSAEMEEEESKSDEGNGNCHRSSSIIILGSGSSGCTPDFACLIKPSDPPCKVCYDSLILPPELNPNYRCNASLLIDYCSGSSEHSYIMIDVGKSFREQVLRWFTHYKIPRVDSIILSHEHANAIHGLDDVRVLQDRIDGNPMPIYLNQFTMDSVAKKFRYLIPSNLTNGIVRYVSQIDWKIIKSCSETSFIASGLKFVPLPVMHGEGYVNLGFLFGDKYKVAYVSDVSRFPENTENVISKYRSGLQLDLLVIDTNRLHKTTNKGSHFCFSQTLDAVRRIYPKRAILVGMSHDFDYHEHNKILEEWSNEEGISVQLARDGLQIFTDGL